jgi:D-serine deaminase-like pyridoxal phosphate-dependent protein
LHELCGLETPALLLDRDVLDRNVARVRDRTRQLGVELRPHTKTAKSIDVVRRVLDERARGITVSVLKEAEYFFEQGVRDMVYAVGIAPCKLPHIVSLIRRGVELTVVVDSMAAARLLAEAATAARTKVPVLIELDVDAHRCGVSPGSPLLLELGHELARSPAVELHGVLTHAGESYHCRSIDAIREMAERERAGAVAAAKRLRAVGLPAPVVSIGSTPTLLFAEQLAGATEVRAGVYMFNDLFMVGLGICGIEDVAISVLVSVIGHQPRRGWIITDGGWAALSKDRGTSTQSKDQGYGLVCDALGQPLPEDLIVASLNQEHGIIRQREDKPMDVMRLPVGTLLRILPNHACATAGQFDGYHVVVGTPPAVVDFWPRVNGWI